MKKFLSLFLAVLMLASMAVSTSAVRVLKEDGTLAEVGPSISTDKNDDFDLLDYFTFFKLPYGGAFNYKGSTIYTWWYDNCPDCNGLSFQFVKNGQVNYECLEKACGKSGTLKVTVTPDADDKEEDKEENIFSGKLCPDCGGKRTIFLETVSNSIGFLRDQYFCIDCKEDFYTATDLGSSDNDDILSYFVCPSCTAYTYFKDFYRDNGYLFAHYECKNDHDTYRKISSGNINADKYKVYVYCTAGGDYSISGGIGAYYGEKKTIEFDPDYGYVLTDVLVDGESVDVTNNKVEVTVKNNTVVRAYFEKASKLKTYTIEVDAEGRGTVTAKKNGKVVSADEIYADYTDTVTYTFTPASKNYSVASLKVNGKTVPASTTYTVTKIQKNLDIEVVFEWKNPYSDVKASYEDAVEYVTEAGIMSKGSTSGKKIYFNGAAKGSVRTFVDALAEMADVSGILDNTADRVVWAIDNGLISNDTDISAICDVQTACKIVRNYLEALEEINDVRFEDLNYSDSAKETAIEIDMVTEKIYDKNRDLTRYDFAAICYLIAGLEYDD